MATREEVKIIMEELSAAFPDWKPPDVKATMRAYQGALAQYPADLLRQASNRCRDSCLFFPKIVEIKRAISEINANKNTINPLNNFPKMSTSPEMQKTIDAFRQRMVDSGKWTEGHRVNHFNDRQRKAAARSGRQEVTIPSDMSGTSYRSDTAKRSDTSYRSDTSNTSDTSDM